MGFNPANAPYREGLYKRRPNAEYQRFSEEYFAGSDVRIYFGDLWVDEVTGLQFTLVENVAPIFGYASYTWDAVARGNRQIQGTFRINFKEAYYLHSVTNRLELNLKDGGSTGNPFSGADQNASISVDGLTIDHIVQKASNDTETEFEQLATEFEKSLWGASSDSNMQAYTNERGAHSYFYSDKARSDLAKEGFTITIAYGPYKESLNLNQQREVVSTTVHTLAGVQLTGVNQIIDASGQPIQEEYSFIARDLDQKM